MLNPPMTGVEGGKVFSVRGWDNKHNTDTNKIKYILIGKSFAVKKITCCYEVSLQITISSFIYFGLLNQCVVLDFA